jgi:tRNA(Ile)-lysidine synthase
MAFEDSFEQKLACSWPPEQWREVTVLLAVSGGLDSVALLRGMLSIQPPGPGRLVVAHFNHRLRSQDSDADQAFVQELCHTLDVACEHGQPADLLCSTGASGLEAAAREARYTFLRNTAERLGARYVATAHTADDQIETNVQRILRGTGIAGLSGIPHTRP